MFSALPITLLALLFALPVFSQQTSHNDAFRALSLHVKKQPSEPICCLKPLTPTEPVDNGILLSFEEWKARQLAMHTDPTVTPEKDSVLRPPGSSDVAEIGNGSGNMQEPSTTPLDPSSKAPSASDVQQTQEWNDFSYAKIPITDRYNYASLDCSASVHASHRSAKSATSILSSKRDRYMLSPCKTKEDQYVVVELCDDIRIDTVQLANFEFFSGVFKDVTISVAKRYPTGEDGWTHMSTYRGKNIRGVQTFRPPTFLSDFYRFIRIDFHTHYGNEFYCPVSLLRVYGLTHLEEWKWELWESESRAKQLEALKKRALPASAEKAPLPMPSAVESKEIPTAMATEATTAPTRSENNSVPDTPILDYSTAASHTVTSLTTPTGTTPQEIHEQQSSITTSTRTASLSPTTHSDPSIQTTTPIPTMTSTTDSVTTTIPTSAETPVIINVEGINLTVSKASAVSSSTAVAESPRQRVADTPTIVVSAPSPSTAIILPAAPVKGGESIYRTIINRLGEVELDQTLYKRYFEQQNTAIRDVIKHLGEDVGRLEAITRSQALTHQRFSNNWEKQRYQMEMEYSDLLSRLEVLSEEILLEKRLGVAQLCLLLAVLVFLGLTRGSRAEALIDHGSTQLNRSVREWGKRHFTISNNWTNRFKSNSIDLPPIDTTPSHSPERIHTITAGSENLHSRPRVTSTKTYPIHPIKYDGDEGFVPFPSGPRTPLEKLDLNLNSHDYFARPRTRTNSNPRAHTPLLRTPGNRRAQHTVFQRANTSTAVRAQGSIQRSNSYGIQIPPSSSWGSGNPAKSAKKWARTAHLHQVKSFERPTPPARRSTTAIASLGAGANSNANANLNGSLFLEESASKRRRREGSRGAEESAAATPKAGENENFFSLPPSKSNLSASRSLALGNDGDLRLISTAEMENSMLMKPDSDPAVDDGDAWVDTDSIDESELQSRSNTSVLNTVT